MDKPHNRIAEFIEEKINAQNKEEHMTDKELLQMALNALEHYKSPDSTIKALRARLAQPEPEPITMVVSKTGDPSVTMSWWHEPALPVGTPLYTAPPQREWVDLTDEESGAIMEELDAYGTRLYEFARVIEAKLKEKNGG